ncbi:MAG: hypothetical protein ACKOX6_11200 [Bdellovibrio sp.]
MRRSYRPPPKDNSNKPLIGNNAILPNDVTKLLKQISMERNLPVSKLIAYAVDNELDCSTPFNYKIEFPNIEYTEYQYAEEAGKILKYLMAHFQKVGTGLDMLMLCRRDIGIESKERFLMGFKTLMDKELLEEFYPTKVMFLPKRCDLVGNSDNLFHIET